MRYYSRNGYFVLRFLAEDRGQSLDHILDTILATLVTGEKPKVLMSGSRNGLCITTHLSNQIDCCGMDKATRREVEGTSRGKRAKRFPAGSGLCITCEWR